MTIQIRKGADRQFTVKGRPVFLNHGEGKVKLLLDVTYRIVKDEEAQRISSPDPDVRPTEQEMAHMFVVRCEARVPETKEPIELLDENGNPIADAAERTDLLLEQPEIRIAAVKGYGEAQRSDGKGPRRGN